MNEKRLMLMRTMLREVDAGTWSQAAVGTLTFHMAGWLGRHSGCGYSACAVGHAGIDSRFTEQGLRLVRPNGVGDSASTDQFQPEYCGELGWDAVTKFFDLSTKDAEYLFDMTAYSYSAGWGRIAPSIVADRIDGMLGVAV